MQRAPNRPPGRPARQRWAAVLAAIGFVLLAGYQVALALGTPLGEAAWGGGHDTLPTNLRIGSAMSALVFVVASLVILGRVGYWGEGLPFGVFRSGAWVLTVLMALSALANFASSSNWERFLLGPIALLLALLCLVVARSGAAPRR